ncbi:MAG: HAD-IA family hydrolase [Candidatus Pacebacteria bacterium]|nr:HAD-IA family hydrolase [Candidatus Paceibacterota bacterium]
MTGHKIKAITFDYAGVIMLYGNGGMVERVSKLLGVRSDIFKEVYLKHNHLSNVENLEWGEMFLKVVSHFDKSKEMEKKVLDLIEEDRLKRKLNTELINFLPVLRNLGFKVGILSNYTKKLRKILNDQDITKLVDTIVVSGEVGVQKPQKEIFEILFQRLDVKPEETIFIDDSGNSLATAAEIGYTPILFKNNEQLRNDLQRLGIFLGT